MISETLDITYEYYSGHQNTQRETIKYKTWLSREVALMNLANNAIKFSCVRKFIKIQTISCGTEIKK